MCDQSAYLADGLPGETNPVGVLGRDKDVPFVFNLRAEDDAVLPDRPDIADVLRGMRDGVSSKNSTLIN